MISEEIKQVASGNISRSLKNKMGVYKIQNMITNKVYIGSTSDLFKRMNNHLYTLKSDTHHNRHLQKSFNKYGESNFEFSVVEGLLNISELLLREQYWIDKLRSFDSKIGYNITPIAGSFLGYRHTEETKAKISKTITGTKRSLEVRKKASELRTGMKIKPHTEEAKLKISKSNKGKKRNVGSNHSSSKLTEQDVIDIRKRLVNGCHVTDIANDYNVTKTTISGIKNNKIWTHIASIDDENSVKYVGKNRLSDEDVAKIKYLIFEGTSINELSNRFNVGRSTIERIKNGVSYRHVLMA